MNKNSHSRGSEYYELYAQMLAYRIILTKKLFEFSFARVYERLIKYFNGMFTKFELRGSSNSFPKFTW